MDLLQRAVKFFKKIPDPVVGMRLEDPIWGGDYNEIIVTRVSKCKNAIMYKFVTVKGSNVVSNDECDSGSWVWLCTDTYNLIRE